MEKLAFCTGDGWRWWEGETRPLIHTWKQRWKWNLKSLLGPIDVLWSSPDLLEQFIFIYVPFFTSNLKFHKKGGVEKCFVKDSPVFDSTYMISHNHLISNTSFDFYYFFNSIFNKFQGRIQQHYIIYETTMNVFKKRHNFSSLSCMII